MIGCLMDFEEIHITKREDGKGFTLNGKGIVDGKPCAFEFPKLLQPNFSADYVCNTRGIRGELKQIYLKNYLEFKTEVIPIDGKLCDIIIDTEEQIKKLEEEINKIKNDTEKEISRLLGEIEEFRKII